ncbi:MAG: hypothetical protein HUU55_11755 [Myxococcales bacterium]|nr:hypothetical protein [Myxococcales bacterium]
MHHLSVVAIFAFFATTANAQPVVWLDPADDDTGGGTYRYPGLDALPPGLLDLREITIENQGKDVVIRATMNRKIPIARQIRLAEDETQDVFYVQVDLYLDLDGNRKNGYFQAVPGRNIAFSDNTGWDLAIVLTPIAKRVRAALKRGADNSVNIYVPDRLTLKGRVIEARLPSTLFGIYPPDKWGITAMTTSPTFSTSIEPWIDSETPTAENIYTREITQNPGVCGQWKEDSDGRPCTFGGCSPCVNHPRILDVLLPPDIDQAALLRTYSPTQPTTIPLWYRSPPTKETEIMPVRLAETSSSPEKLFRQPLIAISGQSATALVPANPANGLKPGIFVDLVDSSGTVTGKAVIADIVGQVIILHSTSAILSNTSAFVLKSGSP